MKRKVKMMLGILVMLLQAFTVFGQSGTSVDNSVIQPVRLAVTYSKTTNIVFPYAIRSVDRGSQDILVQKAIGVENILQVKAAVIGFKETNLTVVTADGSLYSYLLSYTDKPTALTIRVTAKKYAPEQLAVFSRDATTGEVETNAGKVFDRKPTVKRLTESQHDIGLQVTGVFVFEQYLYLQLKLENNSPINYDINLLRLFVRDKKRSKRTASQEIEITPAYVQGNADNIRNNSAQTVVLAIRKLTIPDKKVLIIQLMEANGGRHLELLLKNKHILKAKAVR
ncbi:conjugative transposon protein TraN [Pedobacter sp. UBA4863]|uniref:conjugative transposon protein TraN n=1 Tax=Pedobacter sp. UBA4863 TaxID=1947060 RepID=UPI0025E42B0C|nr:conjugative transposon protein TraN [Pedobacter sp. UBA4863]